MPRFKLVKEPETTHDSEVVVSFDTDLVDIATAHFHDFLKASGFELPTEEMIEGKTEINSRIVSEDDWMWDDAFESKFRNDGPVGSAGADVIRFPISDS